MLEAASVADIHASMHGPPKERERWMHHACIHAFTYSRSSIHASVAQTALIPGNGSTETSKGGRRTEPEHKPKQTQQEAKKALPQPPPVFVATAAACFFLYHMGRLGLFFPLACFFSSSHPLLFVIVGLIHGCPCSFCFLLRRLSSILLTHLHTHGSVLPLPTCLPACSCATFFLWFWHFGLFHYHHNGITHKMSQRGNPQRTRITQVSGPNAASYLSLSASLSFHIPLWLSRLQLCKQALCPSSTASNRLLPRFSSFPFISRGPYTKVPSRREKSPQKGKSMLEQALRGRKKMTGHQARPFHRHPPASAHNTNKIPRPTPDKQTDRQTVNDQELIALSPARRRCCWGWWWCCPSKRRRKRRGQWRQRPCSERL